MRYACVLLISCCSISPLYAADAPPLPTVEQALASPADLAFDNAQLKDVAAWLARQYRINVLLDEKSLADAGLSDARITRSAKADTLGAALKELIEPYSLKWVSENEVLYLATNERWEHVTHVYRAADAAKAKALCAKMKREYSPERWSTETERKDGTAIVYGRAIIVTHTSADHFAIRRKYADVLKRFDADGSNLLPNKLLARADTEFANAILSDIAEWLAKETGFSVRVDWPSLERAAIFADVRFSQRITGVSRAAALDLLLRKQKLGWTYQDKILTIASLEELASATMTAVFDVRGLVPEDRATDLVDLILGFAPADYLPEMSGQLPIKYAEPGYVVVELPFIAQRTIAQVMQELRWALTDR